MARNKHSKSLGPSGLACARRGRELSMTRHAEHLLDRPGRQPRRENWRDWLRGGKGCADVRATEGRVVAVPVDSLPPTRLRAPVRRIVSRFAGVACPPEVRSGGLTEQVLGEFELLMAVIPVGVRRLIPIAFVLFDQAARLYPPGCGRRFARLGDAEADAYLRAVLARRGGGLAAAVRRLKALVVMCYYELPAVKEQLGYRPDAYIAAVSRRRLDSYGPEIRAGEAAVLAHGRPGTRASVPSGDQAERQ
jgi:hypothetical protein